jgi:sugar/nucleoside kinase (ribokinase family)
VSVVVIGDANVDMEIVLPSGTHHETHGNPEPRLFGGGSAANTAAALARLDVGCRFVGTVGDDSYGRFAVASLAEAGVDTSGVESTGSAPTVMVIVVVPLDGERLIYVWPPTGGAHAELSIETAEFSVSGAEWLHVSGLSLRMSPAREAVLAAMKRARAFGIPVSFDLNLRLENWGWDAGFRTVVEEAIERSDVVMGAAVDEIVPLAGLDNPVAAATALAGDDRLVIARLGPDGAFACFRDQTVRQPGFPVDVVDTVGAGDAFNAGLIAARHRGTSVSEAMRWGNAVAALAVGRSGARSTPTLQEVEALLAL